MATSLGMTPMSFVRSTKMRLRVRSFSDSPKLTRTWFKNLRHWSTQPGGKSRHSPPMRV